MTTDRSLKWEPYVPGSAFGKLLGPLLRCKGETGWRYAVRAEPRLLNEAGNMHGGALAALFDEFIGDLITADLGRSHVTIQYGTTFLSAIAPDDLVEFTHIIHSATRSMTFVEGRATVAGRLCAKADMVFKARRSKTEPES